MRFVFPRDRSAGVRGSWGRPGLSRPGGFRVEAEYVGGGRVWVWVRGGAAPGAARLWPRSGAGWRVGAQVRVAGGTSALGPGRSPPPRLHPCAPAGVSGRLWDCVPWRRFPDCPWHRQCGHRRLSLRDGGGWRSLPFCCCRWLRSFVTACCVFSWVRSQILKKTPSCSPLKIVSLLCFGCR